MCRVKITWYSSSSPFAELGFSQKTDTSESPVKVVPSNFGAPGALKKQVTLSSELASDSDFLAHQLERYRKSHSGRMVLIRVQSWQQLQQQLVHKQLDLYQKDCNGCKSIFVLFTSFCELYFITRQQLCFSS